MLTTAILSQTALNFSNVLRNEEIQSTSLFGLSPPLTATLWMGGARVLVPVLPFVTTSSDGAGSRAVTPVVSSWSNGVSWIIHVRVWTENWTQPGEDLGRLGFKCVGSVWRFHGRQRDWRFISVAVWSWSSVLLVRLVRVWMENWT